MNRKILVLCTASVVLVAGCAQVRLVNPQAAHAPVLEEQVRAFLTADTVPAECERYAVFESISDPLFESKPEEIADVRRRAGKAGANAVQIGTLRNPSTGRAIASVLVPELRLRKAEMVAYRCPEAAGAGAPAPSL